MVQLLVTRFANPDSSDSRKVSCLMAAFRKGHSKVVKYLVRQVRQFPSDADCRRLISTVTDKVNLLISSLVLFFDEQIFYLGPFEEMSDMYGSDYIGERTSGSGSE